MEAFAPTNVTIQSIQCRMHRSVLARVVLAVAGDQRVSQRLRRVLIAMHRSESGASLAQQHLAMLEPKSTLFPAMGCMMTLSRHMV
jgi:hypothetical protein